MSNKDGVLKHFAAAKNICKILLVVPPPPPCGVVFPVFDLDALAEFVVMRETVLQSLDPLELGSWRKAASLSRGNLNAPRPLMESDLDATTRFIAQTMNDAQAKSARHALVHHFQCQAAGFDDGRSPYCLHGESSQIIGLVGLYHAPWEWPGDVWLSWFAVAPEFQGQGAGTAMLEFVRLEASRRGFERMLVETYLDADFDQARGFYARRGFDLLGSIARYLPDGGGLAVFSKTL